VFADMPVRRVFVAVVLLLITVVLYLLWPIYGFVAESNALLRKPWAWETVPVANSCQLSNVAAAFKVEADQACSLLLARQERIRMPSISAAVAIDGGLVWSAAVGWSNLRDKVLATPETLYRIGSTSKPVTGTLLARMIDAGLVKLDEPASEYDDALPNPAWSQLTLRQLASHTAGLPEYETNRDFLGVYHTMALRRPHGNVRQGLGLFDDNPLRYLPGSNFEYSSFDTLLIANLLQSAGQQPFESLVQEWVLEPLSLRTPVRDHPAPERASFYQLDGNRAQLWRPVDLSNKLPGGGFTARPEDLANLGSAWLDPDFIDPQTRKQFWLPQKLNNGEVNEQSYALTWRWNESDHYAHHGGVSKGSMAWLAAYPEHSLVIAMATNTTLERFSDFAGLQTSIVELFTARQRQ
jgi:CubicO group peptidase (beta-lactamase class C family)